MRNIATDLQAGLLVGVVLVPTAMAYGVLAGIGPASGLYGAIVVVLLATLGGGTRGLISGPNIFVTVVLASVVSEHGLAAAFTTAMLSGVILIAFALFRVGRFIAYIPHSVLVGFFTATGIFLVVTQVLPAIGLPQASGDIVNNVKAWAGATVNYEALAVAAITVLVGILWPNRLARYAPGAFVALLVGSAAGIFWLSGAPVIGEIPRGLPEVTWPVLNPAIIPSAFTMALLCAASTLLTSLQVDSITGATHQPNRELIAQSAGHIAAGLVGGIPGGATAATFINVQAGGRGKVSGITATAVVVLALLALPLSEIPLAVLAGIIMVAGYRIIDLDYMRRLRAIPLGYASVMLTTATVAVLIDFTVALLVGLVMAALVEASRSNRRELERLVSVPLLDTEIWPDADPLNSRVGLIVLPDRVSVASARELTRILGGDIRGSEAIIADFSRTTYLDDTSAALIGRLLGGKPVVIAGLHGEPARMLAGFGTLRADQSAPDLERAKAVIRTMVAN